MDDTTPKTTPNSDEALISPGSTATGSGTGIGEERENDADMGEETAE